MRHAHVVGAGLAGLSAAVRLTGAGISVSVSDSAPQAGGRCRSYLDPQLGLTIDNGNHLVLAGNESVVEYLRITGGSARLTGPKDASFPWVDVSTGERWTLRPNGGRLPWWLFSSSRRVPGTTATDYGAFLRLMRAPPGARVRDVVRVEGALWNRLLAPFILSALNTDPLEASAHLAGAVIRGSLALGGQASAPRVAAPTLSAAFVEPALRWLALRRARVQLGTRLRGIESDGTRVTALLFTDETVPVHPGEAVVLALPAWVASALVPQVSAPEEHSSILNAHFAISLPAGTPRLTGCIGGLAEWVFVHEDRVSVTVSAADGHLDTPRPELVDRIWQDVAVALHLPQERLPAYRILIEKRATFAATPAQDAKRPMPLTCFENLFLAGDWTQTGLPATIEGAIRSGRVAAALALRCRNG